MNVKPLCSKIVVDPVVIRSKISKASSWFSG